MLTRKQLFGVGLIVNGMLGSVEIDGLGRLTSMLDG